MRERRWVLIYLIVSIILINFASQPALAADIGTLVLKDGRRIEQVEYTIDKISQVVKYTLPAEKEKYSVSFTDIEAILDANGINVASDLLGRWYRPSTQQPGEETAPPDTAATITEQPPQTARTSGESWLRKDHAVYKKAAEKMWNVAFRLGGHFSVPVGDYYSGVNSGIGFEGDMTVAITNRIGLRFRVSKAGLNVDDDFFWIPFDPMYIRSQTSSLKVVRYVFSALYYIPLTKNPEGRTFFFAETGLGAANHMMDSEIHFIDGTVDKWDNSETKFLTNVGIGIFGMLSESFGYDIGMNFDIIYVGRAADTYYYYSDLQTAMILDFKIGFIVLF